MTIQNGVVKISSATSLQIDLTSIDCKIINWKTCLVRFSLFLLERPVLMKIKDRKDWSVIFWCALEPVMVSYFLSLHYPPWKMNKFWILRFCETHLFMQSFTDTIQPQPSGEILSRAERLKKIHSICSVNWTKLLENQPALWALWSIL